MHYVYDFIFPFRISRVAMPMCKDIYRQYNPHIHQFHLGIVLQFDTLSKKDKSELAKNIATFIRNVFMTFLQGVDTKVPVSLLRSLNPILEQQI